MALQPNLQTHFFAHFPLKERYLPNKFSTFISKNMGVVIEVAKKEEQIKNRSHSSYFKKWADLQVTLSNWLSHPDITLNKILGNNFHLNEQPILNRAEILMLEYSHTAFYSEYVKKFNNLNPV